MVAQAVYLPQQGGIVERSMRQLIEDQAKLGPAERLVSDSLRFRQFEFLRVDGRWMFTRAYLEE